MPLACQTSFAATRSRCPQRQPCASTGMPAPRCRLTSPEVFVCSTSIAECPSRPASLPPCHKKMLRSRQCHSGQAYVLCFAKHSTKRKPDPGPSTPGLRPARKHLPEGLRWRSHPVTHAIPVSPASRDPFRGPFPPPAAAAAVGGAIPGRCNSRRTAGSCRGTLGAAYARPDRPEVQEVNLCIANRRTVEVDWAAEFHAVEEDLVLAEIIAFRGVEEQAKRFLLLDPERDLQPRAVGLRGHVEQLLAFVQVQLLTCGFAATVVFGIDEVGGL